MADENGRRARERYVVLPDLEPERRLRLSIVSVKAAERRSNLQFSQLWSLSQAFSISALTHLFWAGLQWEHPRATEADADKLLQEFIDVGHDLNDAAEIVNDMVDRAGFLRKKAGGPPTPGAPPEPAPEPASAPEPVVSSASPSG